MKALEAWMQPGPEAGSPVGCFATTFGFDVAYFERNCLPAFLGVVDLDDASPEMHPSVRDDMGHRVRECPVSVLYDLTGSPRLDALQIRGWDPIPVRVAEGGVFHPKVAVLLWENALRLVVGSANLTERSYERNLELIATFDHPIPGDGSGGTFTKPAGLALVEACERMIKDLVTPYTRGPGRRALQTVQMAKARIEDSALPETPARGYGMEVAETRPKVSPLSALDRVWPGKDRPSYARIVSPFWDDSPSTNDPLAAISGRLTPQGQMVVVVNSKLDGDSVSSSAPPDLTQRVSNGRRVTVHRVESSVGDGRERSLHAKMILLSSSKSIAVMFGSSNATSAGLGCRPRPNRELNVWLRVPKHSSKGEELEKLLTAGQQIDLQSCGHHPPEDSDLPALDHWPRSLWGLFLRGDGTSWRLVVEADWDDLPESAELKLAEGDAWQRLAEIPIAPSGEREILISGPPAVQAAMVRWKVKGRWHPAAEWLVQIEDHSRLPEPGTGKARTVAQILQHTGDGRSGRMQASGSEQPAGERHGDEEPDDEPERAADRGRAARAKVVDPLQHEANVNRILVRSREQGVFLADLEERLSRRLGSDAVLRNRLDGPWSPMELAERLREEELAARESGSDEWLPGERAFLIAEIGLTLSRVKPDLERPLTLSSFRSAISKAINQLASIINELRPDGGPESLSDLDEYVDQAITEAQRVSAKAGRA